MAGFTLRPAQLPDDAPAIAAIDGSFAGDSYYAAVHEGNAFRLELKPRAAFTKRFWVYDLHREDRGWDEADVAVADGAIRGFAASGYQFWNRRHVLSHIYVHPSHRGTGMGAALLERVFERARAHEAVSVWLETSNLNAAGIAWYRGKGFEFAGLDTALYDGTGTGDEVGVYLLKRFGEQI